MNSTTVARLKDYSAPELVLITTNGTILAGFEHWRLAMLEGRHEINCIECSLSEDEALQFTFSHHQIRCGWNDFVRIRLAMTLEPALQPRALGNMRAGGKFKGSTNLSEADRINVREEIAKRFGIIERPWHRCIRARIACKCRQGKDRDQEHIGNNSKLDYRHFRILQFPYYIGWSGLRFDAWGSSPV